MSTHLVWSLVPPFGFQTIEYADEAAWEAAIASGKVQDPRIGVLHMTPIPDYAAEVSQINSDQDAMLFVLEYEIDAPKNFERKSLEKKREWLLANKPVGA